MERIQKFLANRGAGSRRQIDALLQQGRISVNGKTARPGDQIDGREKIAIDGKPLRLQRHGSRPKILLYHKPVGLVCFAWAGPDQVHGNTQRFAGDRESVRRFAVDHALDQLLRLTAD